MATGDLEQRIQNLENTGKSLAETNRSHEHQIERL